MGTWIAYDPAILISAKLSTQFNFCNSIPHIKILSIFVIVKEIKCDKKLINYLDNITNIKQMIDNNDFDLLLIDECHKLGA